MTAAVRVTKPCGSCGAAVHGAWLCAGCLAALAANVAAVPGAIADLRVTYTRQDRRGPMARRRQLAEAARADPWHERAAAVLAELGAVLERAGMDVGYLHPVRLDAAALAQARADRLADLARQGAVVEFAADLAAVLAAAARVVDRPGDGAEWPYGACGAYGCTERLWGAHDAAVVTCSRCGTGHPDTAERKAWLVELARDRLVSASLAGAWLANRYGGDPTTLAARVRQWAHRGRILPHTADTADNIQDDGVDQDAAAGRGPLYRLGDVEELMVTDLTRRRAKAHRNNHARG